MRLSIITVNLNNREGLAKTMESVFSQSFVDYEYIVIDGGSTDGSVDLIKQHQHRLAYWVSEPDKGVYNAMNKGIAIAKGDYLGFMNSGDCYVSNVLLQVFDKQHNADVLYGDQYFIKENNRRKLKTKPQHLTRFSFFWGSLYHQSSFIKRSLFDNDAYNEGLKINADAEFFLRKIIIEKCSYQHVGMAICEFDTSGISSSHSAAKTISKEREYMHEKYFDAASIPDYYELREFKKSALAPLIAELNQTSGFQYFVARVVRFLLACYRLFKPSKMRK
jgi:glycosyltransferase involved in cell wall biosynthesis